MKISKEVLDTIFKQAENEAPVEACGYIAGKDRVVTKHYQMTNMDKSETHFSLDPREQFQIVKDARREGLDIIAVYHSHPATPARPSQEDIRLAHDPSVLYAIASLANNKRTFKLFNITSGEVKPEPFEII